MLKESCRKKVEKQGDFLACQGSAGCQYGSRVRLVTLEILIISLKMIVTKVSEYLAKKLSNKKYIYDLQTLKEDKSVMLDEHFAELEGAREESTLILRNFYKSEEIFLDMFEDEWREMNKRPINVEYVMSDASLLLPPTGTKPL